MTIKSPLRLFMKVMFHLIATLFILHNSIAQNSREPSSDSVFVDVDVMPQPRGGMKAVSDYVGKTLNYPREAQILNIQGKVFVTFVVGAKGQIENVMILKGIGGGCDEEAARVISGMPDWIPGSLKGRPVRVKYTIPINFTIAGSNTFPKFLLLIVDGKQRIVKDRESLEKLLSNENIDKIKFLKPEEAGNQYGKDGKNGAIIITTKKKQN